MRLYLLRHGLSHANESHLVTGNKDDILCPQGRMQALAAAPLAQRFGLHEKNVFRVVSDWQRARETAALALPDCIFCVDSRLGETDAGNVREMPMAEFEQQYPEFWGEFQPERPYPGGESHADLFTRVCAWLDTMEKTLPQDARILAVTHAGPICCLLQRICKTDMRHFPMFLAANASLTKLEQDAKGTWRLKFFSLTGGENA